MDRELFIAYLATHDAKIDPKRIANFVSDFRRKHAQSPSLTRHSLDQLGCSDRAAAERVRNLTKEGARRAAEKRNEAAPPREGTLARRAHTGPGAPPLPTNLPAGSESLRLQKKRGPHFGSTRAARTSAATVDDMAEGSDPRRAWSLSSNEETSEDAAPMKTVPRAAPAAAAKRHKGGNWGAFSEPGAATDRLSD